MQLKYRKESCVEIVCSSDRFNAPISYVSAYWIYIYRCWTIFVSTMDTVAIDYANVKGCRISPNIFTTTKELDSFVEAVKELSLA